MTGASEAWWRHPLAPFALPLLAVAGVGLLWWTLATQTDAKGDGYFAKRSRLCDKFVAVLLNSKDLVEVQRAGFLVHELDCQITSRATEP